MVLAQAAGPLLKEISKSKPAAQEEMYEDPMELDVSTPRSTSLMNQAAEGMRALGSFFAQAAMGGAEVCSLSILQTLLLSFGRSHGLCLAHCLLTHLLRKTGVRWRTIPVACALV